MGTYPNGISHGYHTENGLPEYHLCQWLFLLPGRYCWWTNEPLIYVGALTPMGLITSPAPIFQTTV